ncbi:Ras-related protein RABF1 (AtRABF1) (Ras-related protein Ara-6) (Ras-related protein Rab5C) (AtRab5C) [Durusdinium trenchii]|uniref:Ras-related protein RABF1 (AtRABF1) (Ras-related protein Ara-6) (Ras-related protein Rab5C) (AtRab5C) n=1 Tax=Durusdinium trenchii TaxID=1381693 RepID=A0ABP0RP62_9DINO
MQKAPFGARYIGLASVDLFKEVAQQDRYLVSRVAAESEVIELERDEYLFHRGDTGDFLLVVISGDVSIRFGPGPSDFKEINFDKTKGGYVIGELAFFTNRHERSADVMVISENLVALKISRSSLQNIFESSHNIWNIIRSMAARYQDGLGGGKMQEPQGSSRVTKQLMALGAQTFRKIRVESSKISSMRLQPGPSASDERTSIAGRGERSTDTDFFSTDDSRDDARSHISFASTATKQTHRGGTRDRTRQLWAENMLVDEGDFLNMVSKLTFYPIRKEQETTIRRVFMRYATTGRAQNFFDGGGHTDENLDDETKRALTLSSAVAMFEDADLPFQKQALEALFQEWEALDRPGYTEPVVDYPSFVSIVASSVKRQQLKLEVEFTFRTLLETRERSALSLQNEWGRVEDIVSTSERWDRLAESGIGLTASHIKAAWMEHLDSDISLHAADEMVFEADPNDLGIVSLRHWMNSIESVHHLELEQSDSWMRLKSELDQARNKKARKVVPGSGTSLMRFESGRSSTSGTRGLMGSFGHSFGGISKQSLLSFKGASKPSIQSFRHGSNMSSVKSLGKKSSRRMVHPEVPKQFNGEQQQEDAARPGAGKRLKAMVVGGSGCGKDAVVRALVGGAAANFEARHVATLGVDVAWHHVMSPSGEMVVWELWGCSGNLRYLPTAQQSYDGAQVVLLVYDASNQESLQQCVFWRNEVQRTIPNARMYLVGNKVDLEDNIRISEDNATKQAESWGVAHFRVSCKTHTGIEKLSNAILQDSLQ